MKKLFIIALSFFMFACSEESTELDETPKCTSSPTLTTNEVSNITDTSMTFSGTIEAPTCDPSVTAQGFVYGLNTLPKTTDKVIEVNGKSIAIEITGLEQNQTYYYRTYFTNPTGTYYGNEISFKTRMIDLIPIYLDTNGITVKARDWAGIGAKATINDVEYTLVNYDIFTQMMRNGDDVSTVCTTRITDMNALFIGDKYFNQDISTWDVSNVTDMNYMLRGTWRFNQDLSAWDVRNVRDMSFMFDNASSFNQDLSAWDVSNVVNMGGMFYDATSFNQDLNAWDVGGVSVMGLMFSEATSFNQDLSAWDVSNVTNMGGMFSYAQNFNQDLSAWDVGGVSSMYDMFAYASSFNQDLSAWDVSNVRSNNGFSDWTPQWTLPKPNFN